MGSSSRMPTRTYEVTDWAELRRNHYYSIRMEYWPKHIRERHHLVNPMEHVVKDMWDWTGLSPIPPIMMRTIEDEIKIKFMLQHLSNNPSLTDDEIENLWRIDYERREEKRRLDMIELENRQRIKVRIQEYKRNLREQRKETHRLRNERRNYKIALRCFTRTLRRTMLFRDELLETSLHPDRIDHWLSLGFGLSDM